MKLITLKEVIDAAVEFAEDCDPNVEVLKGNSTYDIKNISQFGIKPDVIIELGDKIYDGDI